MKARQLIGSATFSPDELSILFEAFDVVWHEVAGDVSSRAVAVDTARLRLATIVLSLAKAGPIDRDHIRREALHAFRRPYRGS
jgi:hypothetical protein